MTSILRFPVRVCGAMFAMNSFKCDAPSRDGFVRVVEVFSPNGLAAKVDSAFPPAVVIAKTHTDKTVRVVALNAAVQAVLAASYGAQVFESVVLGVAVYVVDFIRRPFAMYVQPCKSATKIQAVFDSNGVAYAGVPARIASGYFSGVATIPVSQTLRIVAPVKNAGFWIVIQDAAHMICSEIVSFVDRHVTSFRSWLAKKDLSDVCRHVKPIGG